jgi:hypothetical protein
LALNDLAVLHRRDVVAGLDPAIHPFIEEMDPRASTLARQPGDDAE